MGFTVTHPLRYYLGASARVFSGLLGFVHSHCQRLLGQSLPGRFLLVLLRRQSVKNKEALLWSDRNWQSALASTPRPTRFKLRHQVEGLKVY